MHDSLAGEGNARTTADNRTFILRPQRLVRIVRCVATTIPGSELRALLQSATAFAGSPIQPDYVTACFTRRCVTRCALREEDASRKSLVTAACITRCASRCEYVVSHDVPERRDAILPPDLLSFGIRATRVGNRHLENADVRAREPRRYLGLEPEAIRR